MADTDQVPVPVPDPEAAAAAVLDALNATEEALNATVKFVASAEGTALAYGSLVLMALLPIFFGALRSVHCSKSKVGDVYVLPGKRAPRRGGASPKEPMDGQQCGNR